MLQRIRDEAHRFRQHVPRRATVEADDGERLDGIAGLGETRKKRLVKELGGVNAVKQAELADLQELTWLPDSVAVAVHAKFHPGDGA
jgi:excinuclease ABC subunit C